MCDWWNQNFAEGHVSLQFAMVGLHEDSAEHTGCPTEEGRGGIVVEKDNKALHKSMMKKVKSKFK